MQYVDGKSQLEPEKHMGEESTRAKAVIQSELDVNAVAEAVIAAISTKLPSITDGQSKSVDDFDESSSMAKLADAMIVQRNNNESNFDNLGNVKETKKNKETTDSTIDLLSNID